VVEPRALSKYQAPPELAPGAISFNERAAFVPQNTGKSNKRLAGGTKQ
jgi:hypothetical protein